MDDGSGIQGIDLKNDENGIISTKSVFLQNSIFYPFWYNTMSVKESTFGTSLWIY